jgi:leucyl aminopeptidase
MRIQYSRGSEFLAVRNHVIIVTGTADVARVLESLSLDAEAAMSRIGSSVSEGAVASLAAVGSGTASVHSGKSTKKPKHRVVLHMFNEALPYHSMRAISRGVGAMNAGVCVHVQHLPERFLVPLMHILAKHVYSFDKYKLSSEKLSLKLRAKSSSQSRKTFIVDVNSSESKRRHLEDICRALDCVDVARDLENEPSNQLYPMKFCEVATGLLRGSSPESRVESEILDMAALKREGLNLIVSVGQSSDHAPALLIAKLIRDERYPTICLIGKGVTFDAGGLRLKSAQGMAEMKKDKSGAAIVVAIMRHIARDHGDLRVNLVGLMPMVENVINGRATRPGDIVRAHNGSTVEIADPDAEGRLLLADAISYAKRYSPDFILDFATLTSFASTICCDLSGVYYTKNDSLSQLIYTLGESTGERVWRHPPWTEYKHATTSVVADAKNAAFECTRSGSYMASMFILNFVPPEMLMRWVHFDISTTDTQGTFSGNGALLGMQLVKALAALGLKRDLLEVNRNLKVSSRNLKKVKAKSPKKVKPNKRNPKPKISKGRVHRI